MTKYCEHCEMPMGPGEERHECPTCGWSICFECHSQGGCYYDKPKFSPFTPPEGALSAPPAKSPAADLESAIEAWLYPRGWPM